jgi:hypothetical protein
MEVLKLTTGRTLKRESTTLEGDTGVQIQSTATDTLVVPAIAGWSAIATTFNLIPRDTVNDDVLSNRKEILEWKF